MDVSRAVEELRALHRKLQALQSPAQSKQSPRPKRPTSASKQRGTPQGRRRKGSSPARPRGGTPSKARQSRSPRADLGVAQRPTQIADTPRADQGMQQLQAELIDMRAMMQLLHGTVATLGTAVQHLTRAVDGQAAVAASEHGSTRGAVGIVQEQLQELQGSVQDLTKQQHHLALTARQAQPVRAGPPTSTPPSAESLDGQRRAVQEAVTAAVREEVQAALEPLMRAGSPLATLPQALAAQGQAVQAAVQDSAASMHGAVQGYAQQTDQRVEALHQRLVAIEGAATSKDQGPSRDVLAEAVKGAVSSALASQLPPPQAVPPPPVMLDIPAVAKAVSQAMLPSLREAVAQAVGRAVQAGMAQVSDALTSAVSEALTDAGAQSDSESTRGDSSPPAQSAGSASPRHGRGAGPPAGDTQRPSVAPVSPELDVTSPANPPPPPSPPPPPVGIEASPVPTGLLDLSSVSSVRGGGPMPPPASPGVQPAPEAPDAPSTPPGHSAFRSSPVQPTPERGSADSLPPSAGAPRAGGDEHPSGVGAALGSYVSGFISGMGHALFDSSGSDVEDGASVRSAARPVGSAVLDVSSGVVTPPVKQERMPGGRQAAPPPQGTTLHASWV